jgi:glycosyltransferase involved in cell wall biosynthesis
MMISIVLPSRLARMPGRERFFLEDAVRSIRTQTIAAQIGTQIIVGIDAGAVPPAGLAERLGVLFANADGNSQAAALNAAAARAEGDHLAILEDDDAWHPPFLEIALEALQQADFVASTQLEVDERGEVRRINDFPTPSGWVMPRTTFQAVGPFSVAYRWHLDNEWLGRLSTSGLRRVHLVEATAPVDAEIIDQVRPWLGKVLRNGGPSVRLVRHKHLQPLVVRRVHWNAGTQIIARDEAIKDASRAELTRLEETYGRMPW